MWIDSPIILLPHIGRRRYCSYQGRDSNFFELINPTVSRPSVQIMTTNFHNEYGIININTTYPWWWCQTHKWKNPMNVRPTTSLVRARTSSSLTRFDVPSCRKDRISSRIVEWFIYASFFFSLLGGLSKPICRRRRKKMIISKFGLFIGFCFFLSLSFTSSLRFSFCGMIKKHIFSGFGFYFEAWRLWFDRCSLGVANFFLQETIS